ncbi:MAG: succinyldiaminopimelate transaminase [Gammaproteobacteria bacterium]|nr:succinyldiaminopimelate transaminase [Gammaproteobacteria bacterium]
MNPDLLKLHPYPFERLLALKAGISPPQHKRHIALSIGEPKHPPPRFLHAAIAQHLDHIGSYPLTKGINLLRDSIAQWLTKRFQLNPSSIDAEQQILPVNGTREALFAFAQAVVDRHQDAVVVMPNPFYQIYEGAALLAGAVPWYLNSIAENNFLPDFDTVPNAIWQRCQLLYICTPGNPTGAVMDKKTLQKLIELANKHDFIIASDECYSEIYFDEDNPPVGLLQAAADMGHDNYQRCVVFHSLSKRSNVPGLRSGFVAGDACIVKKFLLYRTYHGCAMPAFTQHASIRLWNDEQHVSDNRARYREKFHVVLKSLTPVLTIRPPDAAFYLWPQTPIDDEVFARELFSQQNVTVLPGSYLSRASHESNPGKNRMRIALVASLDECIEAAQRIVEFVKTN